MPFYSISLELHQADGAVPNCFPILCGLKRNYYISIPPGVYIKSTTSTIQVEFTKLHFVYKIQIDETFLCFATLHMGNAGQSKK